MVDVHEQDVALCLEHQHLFSYDIRHGNHEAQSFFCVVKMKERDARKKEIREKEK